MSALTDQMLAKCSTDASRILFLRELLDITQGEVIAAENETAKYRARIEAIGVLGVAGALKEAWRLLGEAEDEALEDADTIGRLAEQIEKLTDERDAAVLAERAECAKRARTYGVLWGESFDPIENARMGRSQIPGDSIADAIERRGEE